MNALLKKMNWLGKEIGNRVNDLEVDDVLASMGLQKRRSAAGIVLPVLGCLVVGGLLGAGLGLMFAPSSGRRMRQNVEDRMNTLREKFKGSEAGNNMPNGIPSSTPM